MAYIGFNRGFKSGLFNPIVLPGAPIAPPVAPEILDAYSLGVKSELLDGGLRVNAEAFYYKDKNMQLEEIVSGTTYITNAAHATFKGIDFDITIVPISRLTVTASIEVLSGHYDSFPNGQFNVYNPVGGGNCLFTGARSCAGAALPPNYDPVTNSWSLRGNHTVYTPPISSSVSVNYVLPATLGPFDLAVTWMHTGNYYADPDNGLGQVAPSSPSNDKQGPVNLVNASIGWTSLDQHWQARAWGKNLTSQQYWSFAAETAFLTQFTGAPPRTFGFNVTRRW
jgi:iron complex outermembrane receptor protein